ncbi:amidase [Nocardia ninae]|uniref:amidase n=1 Tax=Nocardia ninae NBRC 108245 TaxID=1210091 RepID=A0A511MHN1_9NOCA|nr:amidase [Nocardia ninae]GEM39587.1 putative amidase AmiB2 [Nocardia ninae NBRC 108245]
MDLQDVVSAGVLEQRALLAQGALSTHELVAATLDAIDAAADLNAFTRVCHEQARAEAIERDRERAAGTVGPLHGIPIAIKDEIDVAGSVTSFGTRANSTPVQADAEVVRRLRAAGAVIVGKTTMPEFGQWPYTESSTYGVTRNPWDRTRTTGGSSGGSAAAVAAGLVPVAIGSDGGGSIRIPSACCGLFGLKTQRGRVPVAPFEHLWWALGVTGPLTRGVLDSAVVNDVIRGNTPGDRFTAPDPVMSFEQAARQTTTGLRIGYSTKSPSPLAKPDPEHVRAVLDTATLLADLGHSVFEVDPHYPESLHAFFPQFFGGVRAEVDHVEHPELLERRTRQTVALGAWARRPVVEWAIRQGEAVAHKVDRVFADCDLLLTPTLAGRPPHIGVLDGANTVRAQLRSIPMVAYTALWNVTGHPAASLPAGVGTDGLPLAVQLIGPRNGETTILTVAAQLEQARPHPRPLG